MRLTALLQITLLGAFLGACGSPSRSGGGTAGASTQSCTPDECAQSMQSCSPEGNCVDCLGPTNCADGATCIGGSCQPLITCVSTEDCSATPDTPHCDSTLTICVQCIAAGDCGPDYACESNLCVPIDHQACDATSPCPQGMSCVDALCVTPCATAQDCADSEFCLNEICRPDICTVGTTRCDPQQNAVLTCVGDGERYNASDCVGPNNCLETAGSAACTPWICTPGQVQCGDDFDTQQTCDANGLGFSTSDDCASRNEVCDTGACAPVTCNAGTDFCDAGDVMTCNATGTAGTVKQECGAAEYCDDQTALCTAWVCIPDSGGCTGDTTQLCEADGSGWVAGAECASGDACVGGDCFPVICDAGTAYCKGTLGAQDVYTCNAQGTSESVTENCAATEFCGEDEDSGETVCLAQRCEPGEDTCLGTVAGTCNTDGSGLIGGGTDCDDTNEACFGGQCATKACDDPETFACDQAANAVRYCTDGGTDNSISQQCDVDEFCETGNDECEQQVCVPGDPICNGDVLTTCNTIGSGPTAGGVDCTTTDQVCVQGACLDVICTPNTYFCQGQQVYLCGSQGATSSFVRTCSASYFCQPGLSTCQLDVCTAGATICDGNKVTTCLPDGSGPSPSFSQDCSTTSQACSGGTCMDIICTPSDYFCSSGNVRLCNVTGTASSLYQTCASYQHCNDAPTIASCNQDLCNQTLTGCNGEAVATCNSDGSGFDSAGAACGANLVCDLATTSCLDQAIDTLGTVAAVTATNYLFGNYITVTSSRKLLKTEVYGTALGSQLFTWLVYEKLTGADTYNLIDQQTSVSTGTNVFHSSPTLNVSLVAGRSYLIGARVEGSYTYHRVADSIPDVVSFGTAMGGFYGLDSGTITTTQTVVYNYRMYERLTTDNP